MALGSSAPEIMLTALEIIGNDFQAGDLGPGTIVGSAAFNLFVIIGICIYIIPDGEVRRIKHLRVFFVTASWSILAYLWLYLIVAYISPGVIRIWEGFVTLLLFPLTVGSAYIADKYFLSTKNKARVYRESRHHNMIETEGETDLEAAMRRHTYESNHTKRNSAAECEPLTASSDEVLLAEGQTLTEEILMFEKHRNEYIDILREIRLKNPNVKMGSLENLAELEILNRGPKSRAFYRIQATRKLTGGGHLKTSIGKDKKKSEADAVIQNQKTTLIVFEPAHYTVMEHVGTFDVTIKRVGGNLQNTVYVDYKTENGTATAGSDYEHTEGTLVMMPGQLTSSLTITIIDDDIFEEDEHFYVKLSNPKFSKDSTVKVMLGTPAVATVMILDDDHAGIFHFEEEELNTPESVGEYHVMVQRSSGCRGVVRVEYETKDGTAKAGQDYNATSGVLVFENDEHEKCIPVQIADTETYQKKVSFSLHLQQPFLVQTPHGSAVDDGQMMADPNDMTEEERVAEMGKPRLGEVSKVEITITESTDFRKTVDKLLDRGGGTSLPFGASSWLEQFREAVSVTSACESSYGEMGRDAEDGEEESETQQTPGAGDYIMHYLSLLWKVLFATVPPTEYGGGWVCFVVSIGWIAALTAIINDLASSFGCTIRLKDSVTAITFVALGTSVPDTFASKVAAIGDKYADSSIGNVTGSNAVNVFLGIGVAWTMAAVVNVARGKEFEMEKGNLAFSLTIFCTFALSAILLLVCRRHRHVGGELGGPYKAKVLSSGYLVCIWFLYITLSSLEAYDIIPGF
ncbi:sodium/calcium exchanger 3-like [Watersipora subatra]|uniref:sodium/calcium exchanger 3-like n=1 Tax=Watersipora subatra TaxID=2589382 RepID=UPI00355C010B